MAEQEVAKHAKMAWLAATGKHHSAWHKARELLLEMAVIVFAVSISIWFHSMGEHRHEQAQVKAFLLGLKEDLGADIKQIDIAQAEYHGFDSNFAVLAKLDPAAPPPADFDRRYLLAGANMSFNPLLSRYKGFESSGKLTNIEDAALLNRIVNLYQFVLPSFRTSEGGWRTRHDKLRDYLELDYDLVTGADRRYQRLTAPMGRRLLERAITAPQLYDRFQIYTTQAKAIIAAIDAAYPNH
jgi:hypothetical protein